MTRCKECRFFYENKSECRFNPPVVMVAETKFYDDKNQLGLQSRAVHKMKGAFPKVEPHWSCGKFRPIEPSPNNFPTLE